MNPFLPHRIYNLARKKSNEINHCDQFDKHSVRGSVILRAGRVMFPTHPGCWKQTYIQCLGAFWKKSGGDQEAVERGKALDSDKIRYHCSLDTLLLTYKMGIAARSTSHICSFFGGRGELNKITSLPNLEHTGFSTCSHSCPLCPWEQMIAPVPYCKAWAWSGIRTHTVTESLF